MPVVEVSCPNCAAKLKAPDGMAGKKAKCKKCGTAFRVPGPAPAAESASEGAALSVLAMPIPPLPDDDATEIMMAEPVAEPVAPAPPAAPRPAPVAVAKDVAALPSADPFDFGKPKAAAPAPAPAAPAKGGFGAAKAPAAAAPVAPSPAPKPAAPAPAAPAPSKPALPAVPKKPDSVEEEPKAKKPAKPAKPSKQAEQEYVPAAEPEPENTPAADNPFTLANLFDGPPAGGKKNRDDDEDDDEPRSKKKKRDDDEDDDRRDRKKRRDDDEDDDEPRSKKKRDDDAEDDEPRSKKKKRDGDEDEKPRYQRKEGGSVKALAITGGIGALALALGITAVIVYSKNKKEPEAVKKEEKKDDGIQIQAGIPPDPVNPKDKKDKDGKPKDKEKEKEKDPEPPPGGRPYAKLPVGLRTITAGMPPAKGAVSDPAKVKPNSQPVLDVAVAGVRRVFPPLDPATGDTYVLVQLAPAAGGKEERLALDTYGPAGNRIAAARLEFEGDGAGTPIVDLHQPTTGPVFLASVAGKLRMWKLNEGKWQVTEPGLSPYADKPDHAKAGVAAAFFAPEPNHVVFVSTAGQVLLYDLATKKPVANSDFAPMGGAPGKVALGQSVAKAEGNGSVVVAVAGTLYQVRAQPGLERVREHDLGGDVGRSLALAASDTPGRLVYVFETAKKEVAVLGLPLGDSANRVLYKWPTETLGEPKAALWTNEEFGGVVCDKGVVWFDDHEGKFLPLVVTQPTGAAAFFADNKHLWYAIPHATMATKSVVVAITGDFYAKAEYGRSFPNALKTVRLDANGLSK